MNDVDQPWLLVGLGNPGAEYEGTRHNIGFDVADELCARTGGSFRRHKRASAVVGEGRLAGQRVVVAKPLTFMNLSGSAVAGLSGFYRVPPGQVVVIHDELDLPLGALRVKLGGGAGGHNGVKSTAASLATPEFLRVRVGIGRPPGQMDPAAYVLRRFSSAQRPEVELAVVTAADAVESLISVGLAATQNKFNS